MTTHFPACFVELPACAQHRRASFYLAMEEYLAKQEADGAYLFAWQLPPTVVMGRNQSAMNEINIDFCHQAGIDIARRKSGGGAIFADENNIMWSLITEGGAIEPIFADFVSSVAESLRALGVPAIPSGRNDITLTDGGKICGNAFYHLRNRNIVHGTMLYDTNPAFMQRALTPPAAKLATKGVKSVRSRVALLKDYLPFGIDQLRQHVLRSLTNRRCLLTEQDVAAIELMEQGYLDANYLFGHRAPHQLSVKEHIADCGFLEIQFCLNDSIISDLHLVGDFFELTDAEAAFRDAFIGTICSPEQITQTVQRLHPAQIIRNLTSQALTALLLKAFQPEVISSPRI